VRRLSRLGRDGGVKAVDGEGVSPSKFLQGSSLYRYLDEAGFSERADSNDFAAGAKSIWPHC
jgi:hypothetical protein